MSINLDDHEIKPAPEPVPPYEVVDGWIARIREEIPDTIGWSEDELLYYIAGCATYKQFYDEVQVVCLCANGGEM